MKMFSKFLLSSGILMLAFSMMELNGQNFTVKELPGVQECIQKEIPHMVKSHQATYAGATYDTIQHSNSYNLIPWDNPEINFSPSGASQYAGDINGDGYDDIIKTYTKIADDRTEDLSDYVNKTLLTYGGETVTSSTEVLYTQIIPVGDINGDGFSFL